jgi:hypothetical protein
MCCRLRFDFSNNGPVDAAQLGRVEAICREWVAAAKPVTSKEVSLAQAKAIKGLRAVFGEVGVVLFFCKSAEPVCYQRLVQPIIGHVWRSKLSL